MPVFKTKNGRLTNYAFNCGYIETKENRAEYIRIWNEGCYHVRHTCNITNKRLFWKSFDTLTSARKCFDNVLKGVTIQ